MHPSMCASNGENRCVFERGKHVDNVCKFVVDGTAMKTFDGPVEDVVFGGTITGGEGSYEILIDRFSK